MAGQKWICLFMLLGLLLLTFEARESTALGSLPYRWYYPFFGGHNIGRRKRRSVTETHPHIFAGIPVLLVQLSSPINGIPRSCSQLYNAGLRQSGIFPIDLDGPEGSMPPVHMNCTLDGTTGQIVIHHDREEEYHSNGHGVYGLRMDINYIQMTYDQVRQFVTSAKSCHYDIRFTCKGSTMNDNGWKNYFGNDKTFMATEGSVQGQECEYSSFTTVTRNITEKVNFPMTQIMAGDTDSTSEELYGKLGPLLCEGVADGSQPKFVTDEGKLEKSNFRILSPDISLRLKLCTAVECGVECVKAGCSRFAVSENECLCEMSFGIDTNYRPYGESAAAGFIIYKMF